MLQLSQYLGLNIIDGRAMGRSEFLLSLFRVGAATEPPQRFGLKSCVCEYIFQM